MEPIELTLAAIQVHKWTVILLEPGTKEPLKGRSWEGSRSTLQKVIRAHLKDGGGIGLDVHESNLCVLDVDRPDATVEMTVEHWPLPPPTSTSPSKGIHIYVARVENLPAVIKWKGERVGEIIRGPHQHVVMPPTPYPGNAKRGVPAGGFYKWLNDPRMNLPILPKQWREYFNIGGIVPSYIDRNTDGLPTEEEWQGPSPAEIIDAALRQPGARQRRGGVKFQCPACRDEGHDRSRDNAIVFPDGKWACAYAPGDSEHRRKIAVALGVMRDLGTEMAPTNYGTEPAEDLGSEPADALGFEAPEDLGTEESS